MADVVRCHPMIMRVSMWVSNPGYPHHVPDRRKDPQHQTLRKVYQADRRRRTLSGRQEDRKTGRQEDRKTGRQEDRKTGAKLWRYRYRIAGKENLFAVGEYCQVPAGETDAEAAIRKASGRFTLAEARQERDRCRGLVKQGVHPAHNRQARSSAMPWLHCGRATTRPNI